LQLKKRDFGVIILRCRINASGTLLFGVGLNTSFVDSGQALVAWDALRSAPMPHRRFLHNYKRGV
jgi:hypothetical protein